MKRVLPFLLALLLLTACGAPAAEPSPSATPQPGIETPQPVPTPAPTEFTYVQPTVPPVQDGVAAHYLPYAGRQPDYIPPMDFTPVSVWQSAPFGEGGRALLYMGEEKDGVTPCKVFSCYDYSKRPLDISISNYANNFDLALSSSREFEVGDGDGDGVVLIDTKSLKGTAELSGDSLVLTYTKAEKQFDSDNVTYVLDDGSPRAVDHNVLSDSYMLIQYLPVKFERLPDEDIGQAMYWLPAFDVEMDTETGTVRGIGVGSNLMELLARFLNRYLNDPRYIDAPALWEEQIYGSVDGLFRMWIEYGEDSTMSVKVLARGTGATMTLDENLSITEISIN